MDKKSVINANKYRGDKGFSMIDSPVDDYDMVYIHLLGRKIQQFVLMQLEEKETFTWFDFMSTAATLRSLEVPTDRTYRLAMGLEDQRTYAERAADRAVNIEMISGEALLDSTWTEASEFLSGNGLRGFNMITWRPGDGLRDLSFETYMDLLIRMLAMLESEGILLGYVSSKYGEIIHQLISYFDNIVMSGGMGFHITWNFNGRNLTYKIQKK